MPVQILQTHIYHKVVESTKVHSEFEKRETQKTEEVLEKSEIQKTRETPETPAKQEVKQQEKFVKDRLPETGTESSSLALFGLASLFGSLAFMKRRRED